MSDADSRQTQSGIEGLARGLVQLKVDASNWKVLWRDPKTGDYWKEYFPQSEHHGGGLASFTILTEEQAELEFGSWQH
jgi:hypothetical protein